MEPKTVGAGKHPHLDSLEARAHVTEAHRNRTVIPDDVAVTVASWWQSPGTEGRHLTRLAQGDSVGLVDLLDDINSARRYAAEGDVEELDALTAWALSKTE